MINNHYENVSESNQKHFMFLGHNIVACAGKQKNICFCITEACVAGGISRASAFFSDRMLWSWPPSSEGFGEESSEGISLSISERAPPLAHAGFARARKIHSCPLIPPAAQASIIVSPFATSFKIHHVGYQPSLVSLFPRPSTGIRFCSKTQFFYMDLSYPVKTLSENATFPKLLETMTSQHLIMHRIRMFMLPCYPAYF